jgi:hypothetical protein
VCAALDDLVIALYVTVDELLEPRRGPGCRPRLSDAELVCLAVAQALLGYDSERRWLRAVADRLGHLFPYACGQAAYNRRLRRAAPLVAQVLRALAVACPSWCDQWRLLDATPVPCGTSRGTVKRSQLAGWAGYGYDASHHRFYWGSSCTCWLPRTACRSPGAWPTPPWGAAGRRGAAGPRRPPGRAAPRAGRPGRQGLGGARVRGARG